MKQDTRHIETGSMIKNNLPSFLIAIISLLLIVCALFLFSRAFQQKTSMQETQQSLSVNSSISSSIFDMNAMVQSSNSKSSNASQSEQYSTYNAFASVSSSSVISSQNISSSQGVSSAPTTSIAQGTLRVRYVGGDRNFEVIECAIKEPQLCKAGFSFSYTTPPNAQVGDIYIMTGGQIEDDGSYVSLQGYSLQKE